MYSCLQVYMQKILDKMFCNAIMTKKKKGTTQSFECMFGDEITKERLYGVAVKLYQYQDWYDTATDLKVTHKAFEHPVATVAKSIRKPCK